MEMMTANAKLTAISMERFKSFKTHTRVDLAPLTIIIGRNNSGKSTLIQSLLLLKQTLADVRPAEMLRLDGLVDAFSLRELTFGHPAQGPRVVGPVIELEWESEVDVRAALDDLSSPDMDNLAKHSGVSWLKRAPERRTLVTSMTLHTVEINGAALVETVELRSRGGDDQPTARVEWRDEKWACSWNGKAANQIYVEFAHFIPYFQIDRQRVGRRDRQRAWQNAYYIVFAQPLAALWGLLQDMQYLGAFREPPSSLFRAATADPNEIGVGGQWAAQLLHRRQSDVVHFLPPVMAAGPSPDDLNVVLGLPLLEALNRVFDALSVEVPLRIEEIRDVGFRLLFGDDSLIHVGRGLTDLLPQIELGLFADPLRFSGETGALSLDAYATQCCAFTHIALEEPEAHLHPKVASRLAHWFVSLARANRRLLVETHSDHLVRRLRGMVVRAGGRGQPARTMAFGECGYSLRRAGRGRAFPRHQQPPDRRRRRRRDLACGLHGRIHRRGKRHLLREAGQNRTAAATAIPRGLFGGRGARLRRDTMIGLLDPALFLPRDDISVRHDLDDVARTCIMNNIALPPLSEYWKDLWSEYGSVLERRSTPETKRALQALRQLGKSEPAIAALDAGQVWRRGFRQLFGTPWLSEGWEERMAKAVVRAVASRNEVVLFTRRILERNLTRHTAGNTTLDENTRWVLHVQPPGIGHQQIRCIHHRRNLAYRWTTRFDWRLPDTGHYRFCPPDHWWKIGTTV